MSIQDQIADIEAGFGNGDYDGFTPESVANLRQTVEDVGVMLGMADSQAGAAIQAAVDGLEVAPVVPAEGLLVCAVKSMLAKIGKLLKVPFTWSGDGLPSFVSSNPAICGVTADGTLVPMKIGIAVITISAPGNEDVVFAVSVSA